MYIYKRKRSWRVCIYKISSKQMILRSNNEEYEVERGYHCFITPFHVNHIFFVVPLPSPLIVLCSVPVSSVPLAHDCK